MQTEKDKHIEPAGNRFVYGSTMAEMALWHLSLILREVVENNSKKTDRAETAVEKSESGELKDKHH